MASQRWRFSRLGGRQPPWEPAKVPLAAYVRPRPQQYLLGGIILCEFTLGNMHLMLLHDLIAKCMWQTYMHGMVL